MTYLIYTIDFGSNSNKYLVAIYRNKTLKILKKDSIVHKIKKNKDIEEYEKKLEILIKNLKTEIVTIKKMHKIRKIFSSSVGTEFYRLESTIRDKIIEINQKYLKNIDTNFRVISQEEESKLSSKGIDFFFKEYIAIDLGGASTEITIKTNNIYKKFLYKFGCLSEENNYNFINNFINFHKQNIKNAELILIGGSFIATLLSIKKIKSTKFFYTLETQEMERFFKLIINKKEKEISAIYPFLKDREESVKKALDFIIHLLNSIGIKKTRISLLTLLEGLAIDLLELNKIELNKITKGRKRE